MQITSKQENEDKFVKVASSPDKGESFATILVFSLAAVWILLGTLIAQVSGWFIEQMVFDGTLGIPPVQWTVIIIYALYIIVPSAILMKLTHSVRLKSAYRMLFLAGLFNLLLVPGRLFKITGAELLSGFQLAVLVITLCGELLFIWLWNDKKLKIVPNQSDDIPLVILIGAMLGIPWILWGALGSTLDMFLNILVGLLFGFVCSVTLTGVLYNPPYSITNRRSILNFLFDGFICFLTLLVLVTGLGQNGNQWLLLSGVPVLGWSCVGFIRVTRHDKLTDEIVLFPNAIVLALLIGIATSWILLFYDPDELMLVIGVDHGEIIQWALRSALISFAIGLFVNITLYFRFRSTTLSKKTSLFIKTIAILGWLGASGLYFYEGRNGFFGEWFFVIFKDQADITAIASIPEYHERRDKIYQVLVSQADKSQSALVNKLDRLHIPYHRYYLINGLEIQAGPIIRLWIESLPEVDRVLDSPHLRPLPAARSVNTGKATVPPELLWNLSMIEADRVWGELGITGKGIVVGQSDSGVQGDHPELEDSYRGKDGNNDYNWLDPRQGSNNPTDIGGHGTHTLGIILGNHVGVAPDAEWIGCSNLSRNLGNPAYYLDCWQFMLAPFPQDGDPLKDGNPLFGADILNNSWGCPWVEGCDSTTFLPAVKTLRTAGIFVVVSAGNSGYSGCGSVDTPPAIYDEVYTVGAVNNAGNLTEFSSLGPVEVDGSYRIKPDILAPGGDVISSYPGSSYEVASGTSMAGPHLVGVVALMWSANKNLVGNIEATEKMLDKSTISYKGTYPNCVNHGKSIPDNAAGYGIVDAFKAVNLAINFGK